MHVDLNHRPIADAAERDERPVTLGVVSFGPAADPERVEAMRRLEESLRTGELAIARVEPANYRSATDGDPATATDIDCASALVVAVGRTLPECAADLGVHDWRRLTRGDCRSIVERATAEARAMPQPGVEDLRAGGYFDRARAETTRDAGNRISAEEARRIYERLDDERQQLARIVTSRLRGYDRETQTAVLAYARLTLEREAAEGGREVTAPRWSAYGVERESAQVGAVELVTAPAKGGAFEALVYHRGTLTSAPAETREEARSLAVQMARDLLRGWGGQLDALEKVEVGP